MDSKQITQLKKELKNIADFPWKKVDGYTVTSDIGETFVLSFEIFENEDSNDFPIQLIAAVYTAGRKAWSWGCIGKEDTQLVINAFVAIKREVQRAESEARDGVAKSVGDMIKGGGLIFRAKR